MKELTDFDLDVMNALKDFPTNEIGVVTITEFN